MNDTTSSPAPTVDEIRRQLDRLVAGPQLRASKNLVGFLRFVVQESLAGQETRLKEYTIGVEVFGRGESFNPKIDGVVRVQAGLLRKKIASYYATEGRADPVIIEVPKGAYVPVFRTASVTPDAAASSASSGNRLGRTVGLLALVALPGLLLAMFLAGRRPAQMAKLPLPGPPWAGFFDGSAPTTLAFGTPQFFSAAGVWLRDVEANTPEEGGRSRLRSIETTLGEPLKPKEIYTGIGETNGAVALAQMFGRHGRELRVVRSRHLTWDDVKDTNVVVLSSARFHTLADQLAYPTDFALVADVSQGKENNPDRDLVVNRKPRPGEDARYAIRPDRDYATVTAWPGKTPGRRILVLKGRNTWSTQAAADYVTRPEYLADLAQHLERCRQTSGAAVHPSSFEVLLQVEIRDDQPLGIVYVTHHDF